MNRSTRRAIGSIAAVAVGAGLVLTAPSIALADKGGTPNPGKGNGPKIAENVQILSFNDYHGHITSPDTGTQGGGQYLSTKLDQLRESAPDGRTLTVAAGDLIGGSPFLSGLFHDEPSVESLNAMGLDISSVGNHEFDEGTTELLRMQNGGCHPVDGCYFPDDPYAGADFDWLAANVFNAGTDTTLLPGTKVEDLDGTKVGFIGMTLESTPTLVSPTGVADVEFKDEVETANAEAKKLRKMGVKAIVVLLHEGGIPVLGSPINSCDGVSSPIAEIAGAMDADIDLIVTGHTHQAYICSFADPHGKPRLVTSASQYGRVVTETTLAFTPSGDVDRAKTVAVNHVVDGVEADPAITEIVTKWNTIAAPLAGRVVGTVAEDITGDAGGNRAIETPMADLVADGILAATAEPEDGGAQIAFMNVGGVRASLLLADDPDDTSDGVLPGQVTYSEAFDVNPFNNIIVTIDLTGAQIEEALNQQYQPIASRGSRPMLALGVSEGFSYEWNDDDLDNRFVVPGSMTLNGVPLVADQVYRVALYNFLADGGDAFTAFAEGTNRVGGPEDLAAFVDYLEANPGLTAPASRIDGL
ncbi:bifunctional metallophosphatase/5'-nucleotidase [Microbacterium hominis]|uniref:Bifunctional metallophosphatase/5'-nucleotidase n=1 Tax=Microbacterium hominis TaxID=162426 RepID=A0A7D4UIL3_9MICO|nr:bifunctional metallophosphatase/5'-nucleotidase [Microbacterium hominis]QKJ18607.1 bifunctional metallophosphatase/5'-nucleotidase [Microbacterium hominis]